MCDKTKTTAYIRDHLLIHVHSFISKGPNENPIILLIRSKNVGASEEAQQVRAAAIKAD